MPFLSAADSLLLPPDDGFDPITKQLGAAIPDYALDFSVTDDYKGKGFAFDGCVAPSFLVAPEAVDEHFLICRYERLFAFKGATPPHYYLVPWLGVPVTGGGSANLSPVPASNPYRLKVTLNKLVAKTLAAAAAAQKQRKLKLVPSKAGISAVWATTNNAELVVPDVTALARQDVSVTIVASAYSEHGESIEIREVKAGGGWGKTVGKVRICFLKTLEVRAFLIRVADNGSSYRFSRLPASAAPVAVESDGPTNYLHADIIDEANQFGLNQIGLSIQIEDASCDMYGSDNKRLFFNPDDSTKTIDIAKPVAATGQKPLTPVEQYESCFTEFIDKIRYVKGTGTGKLSKHSRLYLLIAEVKSLGNPGVCTKAWFPVSEPNKSIPFRSYIYPPNVSSYRNFDPDAIATAIFTERLKDQVLYKTIVHETSHALLLDHSFEYRTPAPKPSTATYFPMLTEAHQILSMYIKGPYITNFPETFNDNKLTIKDFVILGRQTLYDDIIDQGMSVAINKFIDVNMFSGTRPAYLTSGEFLKSSTSLHLADLLIWKCLDNLVKITKKNGRTIMDYIDQPYSWNPVGKEFYMQRRIVFFNRFQWELVRQTAQRINALVYDG